MSDRIERILLAAQADIDTLGSELEIACRERDRYRRALEGIRDYLAEEGRPLVGSIEARITEALRP